MSVHGFYRACIWLPLLLPALVLAMTRALGAAVATGVVTELLAYSLVFGGVPYAALALWATWWVRGRSEDDIRRLMWRAPLLMAALFATLAATVGAFVGAPLPFLSLALAGGAAALVLGYLYVGVTMVLRYALGARLTSTPR